MRSNDAQGEAMRSNDDIPADEMIAAERIAALCDGPADVRFDAYDIEGDIQIEHSPADCLDMAAFIDGELDPAVAELYRKHVGECQYCQGELPRHLEIAARLTELGALMRGPQHAKPFDGSTADHEETQPFPPIDERFDRSDDDTVDQDPEDK